MRMKSRGLLLALVAASATSGCASTKSTSGGQRLDVITREQILESRATNLFEVVQRLRPQWLRVTTTKSFNLETEIVVYQNDMQLGGPDALRQLQPELAFEIQWVDGVKASSQFPGLMSGRHVEGVIVVRTRPPGGD